MKPYLKFLFVIVVSILMMHNSLSAGRCPDMKMKRVHITYEYDGTTVTRDFDPGIRFECNDFTVNPVLSEKNGLNRHHYEINALKKIRLLSVSFQFDYMPDKNDRIFCNGFQSWTTSKEYRPDEKIRNLSGLIKPFARYSGDYMYFKHKSRKGMLHSWTYTYIRYADDSVMFLGSVNEYSGFTLFRYNTGAGELFIEKDVKCQVLSPGASTILLDMFTMKGTDNDVFDAYSGVFKENITRKAKKEGIILPEHIREPATGWTSWYNYYTGITEKIILDNLAEFKKRNIPIQFFQIDDGYQQAVGDWTIENHKFPKGMGYISERIHQAGYKSGLWLAPFICEQKSDLYKNHKDWLLKDFKGKPVKAGYNPLWSGNFYALDMYNPDFRTYLKTVFDTIYNNWKFDMVKVDFLYAACISAPYDKTRGEVMTDAMLLLRQISGDKIILGCGVPLGPAFDIVDYCRIGSDVHLRWEHNILKALHVRERLSTWNALTSTIARRQLTGRFFRNDPDVFILRRGSHHLSKRQQNCLFLINNMFGDLLFTSDNISTYDSTTFNTYFSSFPLVKRADIKVKVVEDDRYIVRSGGKMCNYRTMMNLTNKKWKICLSEGKSFNRHTGKETGKPETIILKPYQIIFFLKIMTQE